MKERDTQGRGEQFLQRSKGDTLFVEEKEMNNKKGLMNLDPSTWGHMDSCSLMTLGRQMASWKGKGDDQDEAPDQLNHNRPSVGDPTIDKHSILQGSRGTEKKSASTLKGQEHVMKEHVMNTIKDSTALSGRGNTVTSDGEEKSLARALKRVEVRVLGPSNQTSP